MPDAEFILTLDVGTSSTRVLLWDREGREAPGVHAQSHYQMRTTDDGGVEMDGGDFLRSVESCLDEALHQAGDRACRIAGVGVSTYWHTLIGLDGSFHPTTPIYSWADTRSADAARRLRSEWDETALHARTGCMIHPSYFPAKLRWLRASNAAAYAGTARWASPSEYLFAELFGAEQSQVSVSMASGTGLFNQARCEWDGETLAALELDAHLLAPVVDLRLPAQGLRSPYAERWPALKAVPFFRAVGDGACGNIGSGCCSPQRPAINLGTSGAIRIVSHAPCTPTGEPETAALPRGLWQYRVDSGRALVGAAFSDGGNVHAWMRQTLNLPTDEQIEQALRDREPGEHGLAFLPFLAGERSMGWNPDARASLFGLHLNTTPVDILAAAMEAVALRFALAARGLFALYPEAQEVIASGGALGHSPAWTQMFADALGKRVTLAADPEASSRGAALLAMEALGQIESAEAMPVELGAAFEPNAERHARCRSLLDEQEALYRRLIETR